MLSVNEKKNVIIRECEEAVKSDQPIYIYGCGQLGKLLCDRLSQCKIDIAGFVIDEEYFQPYSCCENLPVLCIEDVVFDKGNRNQVLIIVAHRDSDAAKIEKYSGKARILDADAFSLFNPDGTLPLDYQFFSSHIQEFKSFYENLEDNKSKDIMNAFLNQKISGDFRYLEKLWDPNQYYDTEIVDFNKIESFFDCGAYNGDSYLSFLRNYKMEMKKEYKGQAYLLEPDEENFQKLSGNCSSYDKCKLLKVGAWNEKGELAFCAGGTSSGIDEYGGVSIDTDSIDHIAQEARVDFIKMDIEGAELNALKGARKTIETYHPILAICVYHKADDLLTIPSYIKSLYSDYHFYLRIYSRYSQELVLYAVCQGSNC